VEFLHVRNFRGNPLIWPQKMQKNNFGVNKVKDIATEFCHRQWENQWCGVPVLLEITNKLIYIKTLAALVWQATALDLNSKQEIC